ncbi:MAG: hypothetical protein GY801_51755 [bacterium]|nr:hypothetical protein [bacterium]
MRNVHQLMGQKKVLILGALALCIFSISLLQSPEKVQEPLPQTGKTGENFDKKRYELGYTDGYNAAKQEDGTAYRQGYEAAKQEIGSGAFTRSGIFGALFGFLLGLCSVMYIKRHDFSVWYRELKKRIELRRAFRTIPQGLAPDIDALAHQIAHSYVEVLVQFRMSKNYVLAQYMKQWRPKLDSMMKKALSLLELIRELEKARAGVDEKELARRIRSLKRTIQSPTGDDNARNSAAKSLQRAKQTRQELLTTQKNLEHCKRTLQEIGAVLESMQLKVSNLKVNTHETDILDELSSELEDEVLALEEALNDMKAEESSSSGQTL